MEFSRLDSLISLDRWYKEKRSSAARLEHSVALAVKQLIRDTIDFVYNGRMTASNARVFAECKRSPDCLLPVMKIFTRGRTYALFFDTNIWFVSIDSPVPVRIQLELMTESVPKRFRELRPPDELLYDNFTTGSQKFSFMVPNYRTLFEVFAALNVDRHSPEELQEYHANKRK